MYSILIFTTMINNDKIFVVDYNTTNRKRYIMENTTINKKSKAWVVKSICLSAIVIAFVALVTSMIIRYKSSDGLSKIERECFNEVTMLYNENIATEYTPVDSTNSYEMVVRDTSKHLRMVENEIVASNFKYKELDSSNELYKNQMTLTYSGLSGIKNIYTIWFNREDDIFDGAIKLDDNNVASFSFQKTEEGYQTTMTGGNEAYTYSLSYESKVYTFTRTKVANGGVTIYSYKDGKLTFDEDKVYSFGLNGTSINVTMTDSTETYVCNVTLITKDSKYMYEYTFLNSGNNKYDVVR